MYLPEMIQRCAVFIHQETTSGSKAVGTGFFLRTGRSKYSSGYGAKVAKDEKVCTYIVTARHVIQGIAKSIVASDVIVRFTTENGGFREIKTSPHDWKVHPTEKDAVDVAAIELPERFLGVDYDGWVVNFDECATAETVKQEGIGVGDKLYITGLFNRLRGDQRNYPIVRSGNIALVPKDLLETVILGQPRCVHAYLIEIRSISGLSGSPVFVSLEGPRRRPGSNSIYESRTPGTYLFGLVFAHWELQSGEMLDDALSPAEKEDLIRINTGIAMVVPADKILDVVNHPDFVSERKRRYAEDAQVHPLIVEAASESIERSQDNDRIADSIVDAGAVARREVPGGL